MVRINLIKPVFLTDQHLIAEYVEIIMLVKYIQKYPNTNNIPKEYCLGKGHQKFFKNKINYLKTRHDKIITEMKKRGFTTRHTIKKTNIKNSKIWKPKEKDKKIIRKRIIEKIKLKNNFYRYHGKIMSKKFLIEMTKKSS